MAELEVLADLVDAGDLPTRARSAGPRMAEVGRRNMAEVDAATIAGVNHELGLRALPRTRRR
jgi:hypothetical protein